MPESPHHIPDVAAGLLRLGCAPVDVYGRPWMLPCAPAGTLRELVARCSRLLGREIKLTHVPWWRVKATGRFVPLVREVNDLADIALQQVFATGPFKFLIKRTY